MIFPDYKSLLPQIIAVQVQANFNSFTPKSD